MSDINDRLHHEEAEGRKDQAGGIFQEAKGHVKKAVGDLTGDTSMEAEGTVDVAAGKAKKVAGDARADAAGALDDAI